MTICYQPARSMNPARVGSDTAATTSTRTRRDLGKRRPTDQSGATDAPPIVVSIVMPCRDEAASVGACVQSAFEGLKRLGVVGEVIVADNGSRDMSRLIAHREGARVISTTPAGYGAAIAGGIAAAHGTFVIVGDSDGTYDFTDLTLFWARLQAGDDLVVGNRFAGHIAPGAMPFLNRYLGNPVLSAIGRRVFQVSVGDFHCGLRAFRRDSIASLHLECAGMEFATEMVAVAALNKLHVSEVPTGLSSALPTRTPHLRPWRDGLRHLRLMLQLRRANTNRKATPKPRTGAHPTAHAVVAATGAD